MSGYAFEDVFDIDETDTYSINWTTNGYLQGAEIVSTSSWTVEAPAGDTNPVTVNSEAGTITGSGTVTNVILSNGTLGNSYILRNAITTDGGRATDRSIYIRTDKV